MPYIAGSARDQPVLFPDVVDDYVSADNPVRFLDAFGPRITWPICCASIYTVTYTVCAPAASWSRRRIAILR